MKKSLALADIQSEKLLQEGDQGMISVHISI
jgi:hypothetical protein